MELNQGKIILLFDHAEVVNKLIVICL